MSEELFGMATPDIINILKTIKLIQKRMKDPDVVDLEYIKVYDKLGKEFTLFFDTYTHIFTKVIRGESLNTLAAGLYYQDKMLRGLMTEEEIADLLAKKYLPSNLKQESDMKLKEMKDKNIL